MDCPEYILRIEGGAGKGAAGDGTVTPDEPKILVFASGRYALVLKGQASISQFQAHYWKLPMSGARRSGEWHVLIPMP